MKKRFVFRLCAIAVFCLASLAIKSETSACKSVCAYECKKAAVMKALIANDAQASPFYHDDGFFIKI